MTGPLASVAAATTPGPETTASRNAIGAFIRHLEDVGLARKRVEF
jgi:hypothetical protein